MSKVGIMSMQRIKNYGSFLQAYALKNMIEHLGHEVQFVDYRVKSPVIINKKTNKIKKMFNILKGNKKIKHKIQFLKHKKLFSKRYNKFLNISNIYNYNPELDTLVIGSDEVFNCLQSNPDVGYSLELFGKDNNANRVITYAASFGNTTLDKLEEYNKTDEISLYLSKIDVISVRDLNSKNIVKKLTNKDVVCNLDPVIIYDYSKDKNFNIQLKNKEKYIIVYAYNGRLSDDEALLIKKYADKNHCKIYSIGGVQKFIDKFVDCSPFEIFSYFENAYAVITDTFHGTIFSILKHKKFVTIVRDSDRFKYGNEEKLTDLLERLNLTDRTIYNLNNIEDIINKSIDYDKIEKIIESERKNTYEYLLKNIH